VSDSGLDAPKSGNDATELTEAQALALAWQAVDSVGGTRSIYRNPRMAYARNAKRDLEIDGHAIEIRYGEIATPAIVTVEQWVFEITDDDIELLLRPVKRRRA
jgi:hypothetical protein